jgi:DNA-directed RNA polymerase specialized sigma subunit
MDIETPSTIDFLNILYRILSFKCELKVLEIKILVWKFYHNMSDKKIGRLLKIQHQEVDVIYKKVLRKLRRK